MYLFYQPNLALSNLTPEESHHATRVLRMRVGDLLEVTDGQGTRATAELTSDEKRSAGFRIIDSHQIPKRSWNIHLAIAPTKNIDRMEWLVEKCTEIGVDRISFIRCSKSERPTVPLERLQKLAVSAMKQSRQAWLPELSDMISFRDFLSVTQEDQRYIAQLDEDNPSHLVALARPGGSSLLLVGPEGDFSHEEVTLALSSGFVRVSLGSNRLRTETAGLFGVAILNGINERR